MALTVLASSVAAQETVRFSDNFSGSLDGWSHPNGDDWSIASGQLRGDFRPYCNNNRNWCPEGDLLLADVHQPRTANWRMEVDFQIASNSSPWGATNYQGPKAMFALWTTYRIKETYSVGSDTWSGGSLSTAALEVRAFGPWRSLATASAPVNWNPSVFNKATLEKNGNLFSFYLNNQLIGTATGSTLVGNPKVGLHVTGTCLFKNFKLTEIGAPVTYSIGGTVRNLGGQPMAGVTVTAVPSGRTAMTDGAGKYSIPALEDRTTYTVTPAYSNALGTWTFSQPLYIKDVLGANVTGADFTVHAPGTETETVRFADDFSGTLAAWVSKGDGWSIANGQLNGFYTVYCGDMRCYHTYLLLADQYQPRTTDWRMEVDFTYTGQANAQATYFESDVNFARWSSDTASEMHDIGWSGNNWAGAPQSIVRWMQQTYAPAWLNAYYTDTHSPAWNPRQWNRANSRSAATSSSTT